MHDFAVGNLVRVEWAEQADDGTELDPGTHPGRIVRVDGSEIVVRFVYTDGTPSEDCRIDVANMRDLRYRADIIAIDRLR